MQFRHGTASMIQYLQMARRWNSIAWMSQRLSMCSCHEPCLYGICHLLQQHRTYISEDQVLPFK
jgi:hypothetical protein